MRQPGEPSIEEILESIKQVISREDRSRVLAAATARTGDAGIDESDGESDGPDNADDVLDLSGLSLAIAPEVPAAAGAAPLLTEPAAQSARGSLAALAGAVQSNPQAAAPAEGPIAFEGMMRELLRPLLSDWLDRNLPTIVERMVAVEIARITGRS